MKEVLGGLLFLIVLIVIAILLIQGTKGCRDKLEREGLKGIVMDIWEGDSTKIDSSKSK